MIVILSLRKSIPLDALLILLYLLPNVPLSPSIMRLRIGVSNPN
jgi:hypothetical protein